MKRLRYIPVIATLMMLAVSCSDDVDYNEGLNAIPENSIQITFSVKDLDIETRAYQNQNEAEIKDLDLYLFNGSGDNADLLLSEHIPVANLTEAVNVNDVKSYNYNLLLSSENYRTGSRCLYAVANAHSEVAGATILKLSDLKNVVIKVGEDGRISTTDGFVMAGDVKTVAEGSTGVSLQLKRIAAKLSVETAEDVDNFEITEIQVVNAASGAYIKSVEALEETTSGLSNFYINSPTTLTFNSEDDYYGYLYPTWGQQDQGEAKRAYLIVKGDYKYASNAEAEECYYRLDFYRNDENDTRANSNLISNVWYQVKITSVKSKGYLTAEEAAAHPESEAMEYEIDDHNADIRSITTDGIRALGASGTIIMTANNTSVLNVKCYSILDENRKNDETKEMDTQPVATVIEGSSWLNLGSCEADLYPTVYANNGDENSPGKCWKFNLSLKNKNQIYSDETAIIRVTWQGLTRDVRVNYNADFNAAEACYVRLTLTRFGDDTPLGHIDNYWGFIAGDGTSDLNFYASSNQIGTTLSSTPRLYGIKAEDNIDGKVRTEGFHFPMPYGAEYDTNPWTYSYRVDFRELWSNSNTIKNISASVPSGDFFDGKIEWEFITDYNFYGTLSYTGSPTSYDYGVGSVTFTITYQNGTSQSLTLALYRTGFFHYDTGTYGDSGENYGSSLKDPGYFYYEVLNLGGKHWLDRNVGAKSARMQITHADNSTVGTDKAAGRYYTIASEGSTTSQKPTVRHGMCPPGYRIPNSTDWDELRLSPNFKSERVTESNESFVTTYYDTQNEDMGNVYFPKARYYNLAKSIETNKGFVESPNSGDDAAGYYWSTSSSSGLEKDQIGNWLKALTLSGSSNNYINGSIPDHKMNIRCIAIPDHASETLYDINLNVKGATHVYLYKPDSNGNKSGIFAFPGKAIGNDLTVRGLDYSKSDDYDNDKSALRFNYTSSIDPGDLFVFFTYVTSDNKITIISSNQATTMQEAQGWKLRNNYNYYFYWESDSINYDKTHIFKPTGDGKGDSSGDEKTKFDVGDIVRIYWYKTQDGYDLKHIYIYYPDDTFPENWPGYYYQNTSTYDRYYYDFTVTKECDYLKAIVNNNDGADNDSKPKNEKKQSTESGIEIKPSEVTKITENGATLYECTSVTWFN